MNRYKAAATIPTVAVATTKMSIFLMIISTATAFAASIAPCEALVITAITTIPLGMIPMHL